MLSRSESGQAQGQGYAQGHWDSWSGSGSVAQLISVGAKVRIRVTDKKCPIQCSFSGFVLGLNKMLSRSGLVYGWGHVQGQGQCQELHDNLTLY